MATSESQMRSSVEQSSKRPGIKPGGIAGSTNLINWPTSAEQSREGHSIKPVFICVLLCVLTNVLQFLCNDIAANQCILYMYIVCYVLCMLMILCTYIFSLFAVSYGILYFNNTEKTTFEWVNFRMLRVMFASPWDFEV